ncbi:MAG: glycosyltransferase [Candidatus Aenigmarchaeota archaeon]|nr:glycosyltransferase [Candidatus Aenigmarchaeota archaeon]
MGISVVVCAKNEEKYIEDCLKYLKNQTLKPEIVVVDGHSTDKTFSIAKKYADKVVKDNKKGIGDARNLGWKTAREDIVAYCDADCLPPKNWVEKISKLMKNNICISGPLYPYDGDSLMKIHFKVWTNLVTRFFSSLGFHYIWGPNMIFKKHILKKHSFRVNFLEDYELSKRIRRVGKIKILKDITMPVSIRHLKHGFFLSVLKYYGSNYLRIKLKRKQKIGDYWK